MGNIDSDALKQLQYSFYIESDAVDRVYISISY